LSHVARISLVDGVARQLQSIIEREGWAAGHKLATEAELMQQFKVSRSVLREAIGWLKAVGLVEVVHGQGMFVGNPRSLGGCAQFVRTSLAISPGDLLQFTEFRSAVESYAVRQAARRATDAQIAVLEDLCDRMDRRDEPYDEAIKVDFAFHRKLIEITGNQVMLNVMRTMQEYFHTAMVRTTPNPRDHQVSSHLHRAILEAVRQRNPDAAEMAMQAHMEMTRARLEDFARREQLPARGAAPNAEDTAPAELKSSA
jgi:GntR family transcriptional regulator, transcriptional repressor for pyruvate dehydrogenase complex